MSEPGFRLCAALLHEPYHSPPERFPAFWKAEKQVTEAISSGKELSDLVMLLILPLFYDSKAKQDHLPWLFQLSKDEGRLRLVVPALLAVAAADPGYRSTTEVAALTGSGDATWRARCIAGEVPGAKLTGANWIIPEWVLIRYGLLE